MEEAERSTGPQRRGRRMGGGGGGGGGYPVGASYAAP